MALSFGDYDLGSRAFVRLDRPVSAPVRMDAEQVAGRDGEVPTQLVREPLVVTAHCTLKESSRWAWAEVRGELAAALSVTELRRLQLPDEAFWRWASASLGNVETPIGHAATFDVTFTCPDPVGYGARRTATIPSGGSVGVTVGGNMPTAPTITASAAVRDATTQLWGVRADGGDFVHVPCGSDSARWLQVDCESRACLMGASLRTPTMVTLDSDWLSLAPGAHTLANDLGTGAATAAWYERWV